MTTGDLVVLILKSVIIFKTLLSSLKFWLKHFVAVFAVIPTITLIKTFVIGLQKWTDIMHFQSVSDTARQ